MNNLEFLYYLRDAIACLGVLVGLGAAVFLFIRKKTLPAILSLLGFTLLGIEPLLDIFIWRMLGNSASANYDTLNEVYACTSGLTMFLGMVLIVITIILGFREPKLPPPVEEPPADLPPVS